MTSRERVIGNLPICKAPIVQSIIQAEDEPPATLHVLFVPETREYTPEEVWEASRLKPFDRLPWLFIQTMLHSPPFMPGDLEPPAFHYGWRPNVKKLLAFAQAHQLVVTYGDPSEPRHLTDILRPKVPLIYDVSVDPVSRREMLVPKAKTEALWPTAPVPKPTEINVFVTMERALRAVMTGLVRDGLISVWCPERTMLALTLRADEGQNYLVSVFRNSNLTVEGGELPTVKEIRVIAKALGVSGPPKWYADRDHFMWHDLASES
ncbi:hypothetical protein C8Q72DRAFT_645096 [Fomitopsis betulina]|nr:hypothetical protein C8Q72DRAFT_114122 [Fomitopsis betulina]KAI0724879.1 hypothetical protein C8Q72DRAFT_645096 [Fomitopsis betulina]